MRIRGELATDHEAVAVVLEAAFPEDVESRLVARLRSSARPLVSLVAECQNQVVGHILFSPVTLDSAPSLNLLGLAPMAVHPELQRSGIGSALVEAGLRECRDAGAGAVVVLGHPDYYPRFGFLAASHFQIKSEYDVPSEAFMLKELRPSYLSGHRGTISYHAEFSKL